MSMGDRITVLAAGGAVGATLGVGSCSTDARIDDVNRQRNTRIGDVTARIDDVQADILELRAQVINALKNGGPAD